MYNISHKYKRLLFLIVKLAIVITAFYFIYEKLANNQLLSFSQLKEQFSIAFSTHIWALLFILFFTDVNWILEIIKWKTLVSILKKITFLEAYEQCFASLTASIITPNRIGEYGAKALYFEKNKRKKIVLLNFIGNISQLAITVFFGIIGMTFFLKNFDLQVLHLNIENLIIFCILVVLFFIFRKKLGLQKIVLYIHKTSNFLKLISSKIYYKIVGLSVLRYLVFSHQFYFLLVLFGVETNYLTLINLIFCIYFIASFIPSLTIFDWLIKGSVAIWLFHFIGLNELSVISVTTIMWILNFAIPALLGSIFVLNFKLTDK